MNRIAEVMAQEPSISDSDRTRHDIGSIDGAVSFRGVTFGYDDAATVEDITFDIPAGKTVAVVGPTGSGKSTLASLLVREYDPRAGSVSIDGFDLREIPIAVLRSSAGYVPQDPFLFSDTVANNLALGAPDATEEDMAQAARVAQFDGTVAALSQGWNTLLGERGVNLSGGQKQRLTIARALVRNPKILILDDALSSVDAHTEEEILRGLRAATRNRTTLIIAHRISAVRHADEILVLEGGRIVERGTHGDLVQAGGLYAAMHERQLLEEALEERP